MAESRGMRKQEEATAGSSHLDRDTIVWMKQCPQQRPQIVQLIGASIHPLRTIIVLRRLVENVSPDALNKPTNHIYCNNSSRPRQPRYSFTTAPLSSYSCRTHTNTHTLDRHLLNHNGCIKAPSDEWMGPSTAVGSRR